MDWRACDQAGQGHREDAIAALSRRPRTPHPRRSHAARRAGASLSRPSEGRGGAGCRGSFWPTPRGLPQPGSAQKKDPALEGAGWVSRIVARDEEMRYHPLGFLSFPAGSGSCDARYMCSSMRPHQWPSTPSLDCPRSFPARGFGPGLIVPTGIRSRAIRNRSARSLSLVITSAMSTSSRRTSIRRWVATLTSDC